MDFQRCVLSSIKAIVDTDRVYLHSFHAPYVLRKLQVCSSMIIVCTRLAGCMPTHAIIFYVIILLIVRRYATGTCV